MKLGILSKAKLKTKRIPKNKPAMAIEIKMLLVRKLDLDLSALGSSWENWFSKPGVRKPVLFVGELERFDKPGSVLGRLLFSILHAKILRNKL